MKRCYTRSEVRKNRKNLSKWCKRLLIAGLVCGYLFVCTEPGCELPWTLLVLGAICIVAGLAGFVFLDMTSNLYLYNYC